MANRSVIVRLMAEVGNYLTGMKQAKSATEQLGESTEQTSKKSESSFGRLSQMALKNEQAWGTVSTGLLGVGAAAVAGAGLAVKTFADFDKAMSSVQAATHASAGEMDALREAAISAGADTAFSAEEAAAGIEELAKAGVSTADILGGGLDGALALAAAGGIEVGAAAEIAASALTQFKLEGSDVTHVADLLAAGAGKAQGSVHDLGMALNQVGLVAAQQGLTIEETTGGLAAFASAGLVGSDAGTSFKTMLQRLNPQSEAAAALMEELGLSAYDSSGEFIGLSEYAGKLQGALSGMSAEQRNAALQTLFGADAIRAAAVLYEQGAEGVQTWIDNVNDAGYAAETAALMQDNLAGDLEKLGGAIDTVFLKAGSGPNDFLRGITQGAESAVDALGRVPAPVLATGAAIAGVAGTGAILAGGLMKGISAIAETRQALSDLGISGDQIKGKLGTVAKGVGIAGAAFAGFELAKWAGAQGQPAATTLEDIEDALTGLEGAASGTDFSGLFDDLSAGAVGSGMEIRNLDEALQLEHAGGFRGAMLSIGDALGVDNEVSRVRDLFAGMDQTLSGMVESGNVDAAAAGFKQIAEAAERQGIPLEELQQSFPQYADALADAAAASEETAGGMDAVAASADGAAAGAGTVAAGMGEIVDSSGEAVETLEDLVDALSLLGMIQLDAQAATGAFHEALRETVGATEGLTGAITTANGAFDVSTEAGFAAQQAFAGVATSGWDMAEGVAAAGGSFSEIAGSLQQTYDGLVTTAEGFGITGEAAHNLAREALGIPENVDIETWMSNSALQMAEQTGAVASDIPGEVSISTYMSDAAFREALNTRAAALNIPEHEAISSFMESFARDEANKTTAAILGIKPGVSISSWMDSAARGEARQLWDALNAVDGRHTSSTHTHRNITVNETYGSVARVPGQAGGIPERARGGRIPALATGGRLPATGLGQDQILGVSTVDGQPTAWVDDLEWVVNRRSSDKYDTVLGMINRDDSRVQGLAGLATGGRTGQLHANRGENNAQWGARWVKFIERMERSFGKLDRRKSLAFEDGSGTLKFLNGTIIEVDNGLWKVTKSATSSAKSNDRSARSADRAAASADRAANALGGIGQSARRVGNDMATAGLTLNGAALAGNAVAGTFREVSKMTAKAAQEILNATAKIGAQGQTRGKAMGGGLIARKGEADTVWRGRQGQFEQAVAKKYGGIRYSDIYEDGSGQIVLDDGRLIELNQGRWKFVKKFQYGPPKRGRSLSRYAGGGRLPDTGLGTDSILGISAQTGEPTAYVDNLEWVVNRRSSDKYDTALAMINADHPAIRHLAGLAVGGRAGAREYATTAVAPYSGPTSVSASVDPSGIEAAVARGLAGAKVEFRVGQRTLVGIISDAQKFKDRR